MHRSNILPNSLGSGDGARSTYQSNSIQSNSLQFGVFPSRAATLQLIHCPGFHATHVLKTATDVIFYLLGGKDFQAFFQLSHIPTLVETPRYLDRRHSLHQKEKVGVLLSAIHITLVIPH
jgi:hypothetical protein